MSDLTQTILDALIKRSDRLIWATEPRLGAKLRRVDFWTLSPHTGKGHEAISYEIKISRQDFKRDTAIKQREARLYADKFYYVAPQGLIAADEIPDWAGLQEWTGDSFKFTVYAPSLSKSAPSWDFVTALFRSCGRMRRDTATQVTDLQQELFRAKYALKLHKDQPNEQ